MRSDVLLQHRGCPICRAPLGERGGGSLACGECGREFRRDQSGRVDFRLRETDVVRGATGSYSPAGFARARQVTVRLETPCAPPRNRVEGGIPAHLTAAQVSYIPEGGPGRLAVDLGCGRGLQREILERLGYTCYAVDWEGPAADDLVDAHALPLRDETVDLVLSIAVLEHLADPARAVAEVFRVLRRGAWFIGTVAFLEPFHDDSFFHFTHRGLAYVLQGAGFEVEVISSVPGWDVFRAQIEMEVGSGSFGSRMVGRLASVPFVWGLELYGALGRHVARSAGRYERAALRARHTGSFFFVARRPAAPRGDGR